MITVDEKIVGIWYVQTLDTQDWMAALREVEPDQKYELIYRFRYYSAESENPFDGKDKKNWYEGTVSGTRHYCIGALRSVAEALVATGAVGQLYEVLNDDRDLKAFLKKYQDLPFVHMRMQPPSEVR